jgi:exo-beta-1,3-glucanase (GH17 family)
MDGKWIGSGISYGPHRDGQTPNAGPQPTEAQILEDLRIMSRHWGMIRMYGSRGSTEIVCRLIRAEKIPLKVMVGVWIAPEVIKKEGSPDQPAPEAVATNKAEVAMGIKLANAYPDVVMAVSVGNETQVEWSAHRGTPAVLIAYIREVRNAIKQPVTTCDDFAFWKSPAGKAIADECDFIGLHAYAMWNKRLLADALDWTRQTIADVRAAHPDLPIVLAETGWATRKGTEGYQAIGVVATPDERDQELFFRALRDYAYQVELPYFYFQAFDEKWKGGNSPDEIEKHWGVFNSDRSPKRVMKSEPTQTRFPPAK